MNTKEFHADLASVAGRLACAVRFARNETERYGGDPSSLSLFGWSGGANLVSVIAFADPAVPKGCVVASGSVVPDNLVLFDGDWLLAGMPVWDDMLREDPTVLETLAPWSRLASGKRMPVHVLDSNDPALCVKTTAGWLRLRDPAGNLRGSIERLGLLDNGQVCVHDEQRLLYDRLKNLRYEVTYQVLPGSTHEFLSKAGLQVVADTILGRT